MGTASFELFQVAFLHIQSPAEENMEGVFFGLEEHLWLLPSEGAPVKVTRLYHIKIDDV